jgi:hypothetical protein
MTRTPPPDLPERKPVEEMTAEERTAYVADLRRTIRRELADLDRPRRERRLRAGSVVPRNAAEWEIFGARRIRSRRRNVDRAEPIENMPMAEAMEAESDRGRPAREADEPG